MTRYTITLTQRPLTWPERLWYRRLRMTPPLSASGPTKGQWIRHLPQSWTWVHRRHAQRHGLYWLPCILCGRYSGGHQWGDSIPDPTHTGPGQQSIIICPACSRAGRGWRVPHPLEAVLDQLADEYDHGHDDWHTDCVRCLAHDTAVRDAITQYKRDTP